MSVSTNSQILIPPLSSGEEFWARYKLQQHLKNEKAPQEKGSQEE